MFDFTLFGERVHSPQATRFFAIILFTLAFLPRLLAIGRYITPDELIWVFRSIQFREAILAGNWADTLTTGHPGVMTTWFGAGAISLQLLFDPSRYDAYNWILQLAWFAPENTAAFDQLSVFLSTGRILMALINSFGVVILFIIAKRIFSPGVAFIGGFLMALDPFLIGLSGLLHVDSLMTTFGTISLLLLAMTWSGEKRSKEKLLFALLSGMFAAFALLSKTPAALLLPLSIFFLLLANFKRLQQKWEWGLRPFIMQSLCWMATFGLTLFIALPALWISPVQVFNMLSGETSKHIDSALRPSFFMGQVAFEHGSLFYPVSLAFRLSPLVIVAIFLSFLIMVRWVRAGTPLQNQAFLTVLLLLSWSFLFVVGISFAEKKFDRYAVAVFPALIVIAAVYWGNVAKSWRHIVWPLVMMAQVVYLLFYLPYPLAAYNPLVGGAAVAENVLPIGWGEAISASGQWLADLPHVEEKTAVSPIAPSLAPFFPGETLLFEPETIAQADYLILTANSRQLASQAEIGEWIQGSTLLHTVRFGGLDQAWIYERPHPVQPTASLELLDEPASFGGQVQLLATQTAVSATQIDLLTQWHVLPGGENGRYLVKLTVEDESGNQWQSVQNALVNEIYFYPESWQPGELPIVRYRIGLPLAMPPASYLLSLSLLDEAIDAQLPILAADGRFMGTTMPIADITVPQQTALMDASRLSIPILHEVVGVDGRLRLLGQDELWETAVNGSTLPVNLYWQAVDKLPSGVTLRFKLGEFIWETPISRFPSQEWRKGELIHENYQVPVPPEISSGIYPVSVTSFDLGNPANDGHAILLGSVQINSLDRQFELPATIKTPLFYILNNEIQLRGFDQNQTDLAPGDTLQATLYWQVLQKPDQNYAAFFHVVGPDGTIIVQADQWPGGLPSDLWVPGQVIVDEHTLELPLNAAAGPYTIAVGLYRPQDGVRLPILDAEGNQMTDGRIILPLE